MFEIFGRRYRISDPERFEAFCGAVALGLMTLAAFVFFFGFCWGGFLR